MGSGYGNSFFISYGICTPRLFSSFPSSILFPLSSSFFRGGGTISRSCYSPFFLSFLLLSLLWTILVPLGILIVRVCRRFSFYAFLAFTVTLWIPYGRVGYEKFRKNGITTSIILSRCAPVTGPNQGFDDKVWFPLIDASVTPIYRYCIIIRGSGPRQPRLFLAKVKFPW